MGAKPRRVGRPAKNTWRIELRLDADDQVAQELRREAEARGVPIQRHITDILIARHLNRQAPAQYEEQSMPSEAPPDSASKLADEWM